MSIRSFARRILFAAVVGAASMSTVAIAAGPAPVVAPAPAPAVAPKAPAPLKIAAGSLATAVEAREPVGASSAFDTSVGALYAWVKVKNLGDATTITMVWKKDGKTKLKVTLPVGHSIGWKTWSKKGIGKDDAGVWTVDVQDANGKVVDTLRAEVSGKSTVSAK